MVIVALFSLCAWLGLKLSTAHKDNAELRTRIASLKRQLLRKR